MKRFILPLLLLAVVPWPALAQAPDPVEARKNALAKVLSKAEDEYRLYFKRPTKPLEFWGAIRFEIEVGKYDVAALHLDQLLKLEPPEDTDRDLLTIEEARGLNEFLRVQGIQKWHTNPDLQKEAEQNVVNLINRVSGALEKKLSDPSRITKFIKLLNAPSVEERTFAFAQLNRSGERAAPYFVEALRNSAGKPEFERLRKVMERLRSDLLPPLLEILKAANPEDYQETDVRGLVLDLMRVRREDACLPYLWHIIGSEKYHPMVRARARQTAASFLNVHEDKLPDPKVELTYLAERYYLHQVRFLNPQRIRFWEWTGKELKTKADVFPPAFAEQFFGTRHAKEALDLDPAYRPAQLVLLRLTLERSFAPALDNIQLRPLPPAFHTLLATLDADLLLHTLERAMHERNPAVILPLVRVLGDRREIRAARPSDSGQARGLARALYYPDRRVQWAAMHAMMLQPAGNTPVEAGRVVEILTRFLATEAVSKAAIIGVPPEQKATVRKKVEEAGLVPVLVDTPKALFEALHRSADIDAVIVHQDLPGGDFAHLFSQLRADSDAGLLPVLVLTLENKRARLTQLARPYRNIFIDSLGLLEKDMAETLKERIEGAIKYSQQPDIIFRLPESTKAWIDADLKAAGGFKLSIGEKKQLGSQAVMSLWRMARGDLTGYNVAPAKEALFNAIRVEEYTYHALQALGRLPGVDVQQRLAGIALDSGRPMKAQRIPALIEVNHHVHQHGLLLTLAQLNQVQAIVKEGQALAEDGKANPDYMTHLVVLAGHLRRNPRATGTQLRDFNPPLPAAPPPPPPEK